MIAGNSAEIRTGYLDEYYYIYSPYTDLLGIVC
jgi:hypothetical protein